MSLYNGPPRGGARGGKDQFNWESVKSDKDREFYLGHSVKATVGRWQKGKDVFWYTREKQDDAEAAAQHELAMVKAREEELMMEALGLKPKTVRAKVQPQLDQKEMKQLMERGDDGEEDEAGRTEADRIKGVGYSSGQVRGGGEAEREVMNGLGTAPAFSQLQHGDAGPSTTRQLPAPPQISTEDLKKLRKAQKHQQKAEKKALKKAKKEAKAAKKAKKAARPEKRLRQQSSSSPELSPDSDALDVDPVAKKSKVHHADPESQTQQRSRHRSVDAAEQRPEKHSSRREPERRHIERQSSRGGEWNRRQRSASRSPARHRRSSRHDSPSSPQRQRR